MRELIRLYLQGSFSVVEAQDGTMALGRLTDAEPDLVLLDVMMPRMDGWETLRRIRESSRVPVIMLTARGEVTDRIQGLRMGADDYISKPFDGRELVARVDAVLRRSKSLTQGQTTIRRGEIVVIPDERRATWKGRTLSLTPKEFDLLTFLATNAGQAFPRDRLLDRVWGADYLGDIRTVDSHIKNLREELGDGGSMINTVWGFGYRFVEEPNAKS